MLCFLWILNCCVYKEVTDPGVLPGCTVCKYGRLQCHLYWLALRLPCRLSDWPMLAHQSGVHLTNSSWNRYWNHIEVLFALIFILITQSGLNFAHITTAGLSWHVQNLDLISPLSFAWGSHIRLWVLDHELTNRLWNGSLGRSYCSHWSPL